ncbi:MAG: 50S ribosomal protein L29 [Clostridiales bacterium]|nr:50S ribosomal protein L29 [Clostridiales bacterium]
MKANELNNMTSAELTSKLKELKSELMNLRFQNTINQLDNPHKIDQTKKDIARVMTVLRQKNEQ